MDNIHLPHSGNNLERALLWAYHGFSVLAVPPDRKSPYATELMASIIGIARPDIGGGGLHLATKDETAIKKIWTAFPSARIGIATGNGLIVLDVDSKNGKNGYETLKSLGLEPPLSMWQATPSGGMHYFYRDKSGRPLPTDAGAMGIGLDRRGSNGYVIDYGTINPAWQIVQAPEWLLEGGHTVSERRALGEPSMAAPSLNEAIEVLQSLDPNDLSRDEWIKITAAYKQATFVHDRNDAARIAWNDWCAEYDNNDIHENDKQWRSLKETTVGWKTLLDASPSLKAKYLFGDNGAAKIGGGTPLRTYAEILADVDKLHHGSDLEDIEKLCAEISNLEPIPKERLLQSIRTGTGISMSTLRKQAAKFERPEPDHAQLADKTITLIGQENIIHVESITYKFNEVGVWKACDDRELKQQAIAVMEQEKLSITAARVSGVIDILKSQIFRKHHTFNLGNTESVNCLNGEVHLSNGVWQLYPHYREHYRTTQLPVIYDPAANALEFLNFLYSIFRDDNDKNEKVQLILEMMGYSMMSHANREKFILLIGSGANGKSVLLDTLQALLGSDNVAAVQPSNFDSKFQRAHLHQKLANIVTELKQGETIADAELKAITSGEPATVEHKNKDPFVMRPFATCWFGTNHMPHTRDYSDAFFRRAIVVTFNRVFAPYEQNTNLKASLATELSGILNLALNAYAWVVHKNGFTIPASSKDAEMKWKLETNQVAQFIECCCKVDSGEKVSVDQIYSAYRIWTQTAGVRQILGKLHFGDRLETLGFRRLKGTAGVRLIGGITLNWPQI